MIEIIEHSSKSYSPRTWANASNSDVTIALAVDYSTAGEKLTHKAAGDKYLKLNFNAHSNIELARMLWKRLYGIDSPIINVAGNGIYTLIKHGLTQKYMNDCLFEILEKVHLYYPISKIISGGQTGVDIAGARAGHKLGIPVCVTLPKGLIQRHEDGVDREHTYEEIMKQIVGE
jgi:hypothetical protein